MEMDMFLIQTGHVIRNMFLVQHFIKVRLMFIFHYTVLCYTQIHPDQPMFNSTNRTDQSLTPPLLKALSSDADQ